MASNIYRWYFTQLDEKQALGDSSTLIIVWDAFFIYNLAFDTKDEETWHKHYKSQETKSVVVEKDQNDNNRDECGEVVVEKTVVDTSKKKSRKKKAANIMPDQRQGDEAAEVSNKWGLFNKQ